MNVIELRFIERNTCELYVIDLIDPLILQAPGRARFRACQAINFTIYALQPFIYIRVFIWNFDLCLRPCSNSFVGGARVAMIDRAALQQKESGKNYGGPFEISFY
jgi:hypothetical protein